MSWMAILATNTGKRPEKKQQPTENQKITKYQNVSKRGPGFTFSLPVRQLTPVTYFTAQWSSKDQVEWLLLRPCLVRLTLPRGKSATKMSEWIICNISPNNYTAIRDQIVKMLFAYQHAFFKLLTLLAIVSQ